MTQPATTTPAALPFGFAITGKQHVEFPLSEAVRLVNAAHSGATARVRNEALARLRDGGIWPPIGWQAAPLVGKQFDPEADTPFARMAERRAVERETVQATHYDPDAERAGRIAAGLPVTPEAAPVVIDADLSKCGGGKRRCHYGPDGGCTHRPCGKRRQRTPKRKITPPEQPALHKPDGCLEVGVGPVREGPSAASFDAAAGSALGEPTGGTSTLNPSEIPLTPTPIPPASSGVSQTAGTVVEDSLPLATVPAALPTTQPGGITLMADLEEAIAALPAHGPEAPRSFGALQMAPDKAAAWVIGKLLDRQAQINRVKAQAEAMTKELEADLRSLAWRFALPLEDWARAQINGGRKRSSKTLAGTVGFTGGEGAPPRLNIADDNAVEEWALAQDDPERFGRYGFRLDTAAVLKHAKATGEAIPGVEVCASPESFYVKSADGVRVNVTKLRGAASVAVTADEEEEEIAA